ncbi:MAG: PAS domain-containing protein [Chloroflexota bacterium]|nr:PAS domain-containing protein [Chloroflexota bacterium]
MIDMGELGALFAGLSTTVTIADEDGCIVFMNDRAIAHYADQGGEALIGTNLRDCHNPTSQEKTRQMYARHRAGDLSPTRYHERRQDGTARSIVVIPITVEGQFRGIAELMWNERRELVHET